MQKIGNLLCKLAIYCVNFGVNFILQKFCPGKKMTNIRYALLQICISRFSVLLTNRCPTNHVLAYPSEYPLSPAMFVMIYALLEDAIISGYEVEGPKLIS